MKYLVEVNGLGGIVVKVVAFSTSKQTGEDIITFELTYPRIIHGEVMTHRLFSRNAASSRAIPVSMMNLLISENTAMPVRFGMNKAGMQDTGERHSTPIEFNGVSYSPESAWYGAIEDAVKWSDAFDKAGYHKQVCNRLTEAGQFMRTVLTFTGAGENFYLLRNHGDADPTLAELARCMLEAHKQAVPVELDVGDWHLPYYTAEDGTIGAWTMQGLKRKGIKGLKAAREISASCCAQASFRQLDDSQERADRVFKRLVDSKPVHASPFEHQASPLHKDCGFRSKFVTAIDRFGNAWSGNFRNWGQWRQVIPGNVAEPVLPTLDKE